MSKRKPEISIPVLEFGIRTVAPERSSVSAQQAMM